MEDGYPTTPAGAGSLVYPSTPAPTGEDGDPATGQIDLTGGGGGAIGQQITIYGKVFRLIVAGSPTPGPGEVTVDFATGPNAGGVLADAINGAGISTTAVNPDPMVALVNLTGPDGTASNVAITTDAPGVVVSGMSGATDGTSARRIAPSGYPTV